MNKNKHGLKLIEAIRAGVTAPCKIHRNLTITPQPDGFAVSHGEKVIVMVSGNRVGIFTDRPSNTTIRYINSALIGLNTPYRVCKSKVHRNVLAICRFNSEGFMTRSQVMSKTEWISIERQINSTQKTFLLATVLCIQKLVKLLNTIHLSGIP